MFDYLDYRNKIPLNKILETIEDIHPYSPKYSLYWINNIKRKQIEGKWVQYKGEWKWIPGPIFQYIQLWNIEIKQQGTKSKGKVIGRPRLRDIEWIKGYVHAVSRGFSGFEKDENYSSHRVLINPDRDDIISTLSDEVKSTLYKPSGELKEYKDALQYLYEYLPDNYGKPLYLNEAKNVIDIECRNIGKAQPLDAVVQTELGTKQFKDIKIGDRIFGDDGKLTTITGVFPQGKKEIYKISLKDGRSTECCKEHLWTVYHRGKWETVDINRILNTQYKTYRKNGYEEYYYRIPLTKPVQYSEKEFFIDPYYLGVWLGDGCSRSCGLTSADPEILEKVSNYASKLNLKLKHSGKYDYRLTNERGKGNELLNKLKEYNLIKNKHIPEEYFYGSVQQRLELLRGLLDTDGTISKTGYITFDNVNFNLVKDVERLSLSLGITTNVTEKKTSWIYKGEKKFSKSYRVHMDTDLEVFYLPRKKDRITKLRSNKRKIQSTTVAITNIEFIGYKEAACIMVDNKSHLYLTNDFIVTHNTMITGNFAGHNFLTDGITDFDEYVENKNKPESEKVVYTTQTLISAIDGKYVNNLVKHLKTGLEYLPGRKQVGETLFPPPLSKTIRGSWRVGEDVKNEYDYKVGNKWEVRGTKSGFNLRSFMDNPFAANGLRYGFGVIDEIGFMGIIEEVLGQLEECTTVDGEKYGTIWMTGTGGDFKDGGATHNVRKVFEDPKAYNCLEFDDIFENSGKKIGFFVPAWMALDEFRDEFGNVNKELALKKLNREREEKKKAKTKQAYYNLLPTKPLSWTEAFLSTSRQRFPANLIEEQIKILTEPELKKHEVGKLMFNAEGKLEFIHDFNLDPYREYPVKEFLPGAIEIFERPQDSEDAPLIPFRYIIGVDPYKYDVSKEIQSIGSCIVFDRLTRRIVAEYSGRPDTTNIFYETCRKLCLFYNATLMYESNFTNMYHYFEEKRSLHLLADTPMTLRDRNTWKINTNTSKGIIATTPINERGLEFIENYLMESLSENSDLTRTSTVRSLGLLRELRGWTPDNNTDRISAFSMVMWYDITLGSLSNQEEVRERNQKKFGEYFNQFRKNPYNMSKTDMMFEKHF